MNEYTILVSLEHTITIIAKSEEEAHDKAFEFAEIDLPVGYEINTRTLEVN